MNKKVYFTILTFLVLVGNMDKICCQEKHLIPTEAEKLAFLAGAILGDNTICIAGGHPMSAAKKTLFKRTLKDLGIPERMIGKIMQFLHESEKAKKVKNITLALNKTAEALSETEKAVKVTQGPQLARLVRFGPPVMIAVETARTVEIAFEVGYTAASIIIVKKLQGAVKSLKNNISKLNLPPQVESHIYSVASYFREGSASVKEKDIREIKERLSQLLKIYGTRPLTEMQLRGKRVHFEDPIFLFDKTSDFKSKEEIEKSRIFIEAKKAEKAKLHIIKGMLYLDKKLMGEALHEFKSVLGIEGIEKTQPIIAAKAHRLIATVSLLTPNFPPLSSSLNLNKVLNHLRNSISLDPNQLKNAEIKKQVGILKDALESGNILANDYLKLINLMLELLKQDRGS